MMFNSIKFVDKIYCINLDRRPDRWELASQQFIKHGLQVERFPAVDGRDFKKEYRQDNGNNGCTLSHYFIIERAKLLGLDAVMVFEDDVELHRDFQKLLHVVLTDLKEMHYDDWSMLYFGGSHREQPIPVAETFMRVTKTLTTHGYIIRSSMFDLVINNFKNLDQPVDCFYASWQKEYPVYITNPPLAWQRKSYSDIVGREMDYPWIKSNKQ